MLFDILFVFVVALISSSCFCTTNVYGLPTSSSPSSSSSSSSPLSSSERLNIDHRHHQLHRQPTVAAAAAAFADPTSTLRLFQHQPVPRFEYDLGGDITEMLVGESNEYSSMPTDDDDDDDASLPNISSFESLNSYVHPLSRKLFVQTAKHLQGEDDNNQAEDEEEEAEEKRKRSNPPMFNVPASQFNIKSAFPTDPLNSNSIVNLNRLSESTRLSPSLQTLVETNPFARAWLTMLLQKVMEEQPVPYIFKYGRRRK